MTLPLNKQLYWRDMNLIRENRNQWLTIACWAFALAGSVAEQARLASFWRAENEHLWLRAAQVWRDNDCLIEVLQAIASAADLEEAKGLAEAALERWSRV
ncbi:MAG: hypothetical protein KJ077_11295 [Anaerolineae bacterium]|nr:hypothetical protein [Anaerolineae bacterium]